MSNSPINFLGALGAAGAIMGSRRSKKSRSSFNRLQGQNQRMAIQTSRLQRTKGHMV